MKDYGTVDYNGKTYTLTQEAYVDNYGTKGAVRYYAHAIDEAGNEYIIAWDTTEAWDLATERAKLDAESYLDEADAERLAELLDLVLPDVSDESNACDWGNPVRVTPS